MTEPGTPRPGDRIPVEALMAAQQEERRAQRRRVLAVSAATLAATGVVGGVALGMIADDEDAQPTAQTSDTTALPSDEATESTGIPSPSASAGGDEETDGGSVGESLPEGETEAAPEEPADTEPEEPTDTEPEEPTDTEPEEPTDTEPEEPSDTEPEEPQRHVVAAGESLWSITADLLGPGATAEDVVESWPELYEANRDVIGGDPNLILIDAELTVPAALT